MRFDTPYAMTIGGRRVDGGRTFGVRNPATAEIFAEAPDCELAQLDEAVEVARAARSAWRDTSWEQRCRLVRQFASLILDNLDPLKQLLTAEQGKPHGDAEGELRRAVEWLQETATLQLPHIVNAESPTRRSFTRHTPVGVVGAISPWNFPVALSMWKVAPALVAGNTVVLKPSPFTPLTVLRIGELAQEILPAGVLNVISGGDALGPPMTAHPGIDKISFTGSTETGRRVMASAAPTLKRLTLELGGNDAAIVMPDVPVADIAERVFWSAFRNAGQVCIAAKRLYVHADVYDEMAEALSDLARGARVGDGAQPGVQIGPVQNHQQHSRIVDLLEDAKAGGGRFLAGGEALRSPGYFIAPTLVDNPPEDARVVAEEQFGPVLPLIKVSSANDAVERANRSIFGLGASIWTRDLALAQSMAERLEAGSVWINEPPSTSPLAAFGGHKQSGVGVENGLLGLMEYANTQTVVTNELA